MSLGDSADGNIGYYDRTSSSDRTSRLNNAFAGGIKILDVVGLAVGITGHSGIIGTDRKR